MQEFSEQFNRDLEVLKTQQGGGEIGVEKMEIAEIPEKLQRYIPTIKKFIENHKYILATIARNPLLRYEPSTGKTFEFHPEEGKNLFERQAVGMGRKSRA